MKLIFILSAIAIFCLASTVQGKLACNDKPVAKCIKNVPVFALNAAGKVFLNASDIDAGSTTTCPPIGLQIANAPLNNTAVCFNSTFAPPYILPLYLVVTSQGNQSSVCVAAVEIVDLIPPVAICKPASVGSNAVLSASSVDGGSYDNCFIQTESVNQTSFPECNTTVPVQLTLTDSEGNFNSCTTFVQVTDTTPPQALCQSVTENIGATGSVTIPKSDGSLVNDGSSDSCDGTNLLFQFSFSGSLTVTCANLTQNLIVPVTMEAIDSSGNIGYCNTDIFFEDITPPTPVCIPSKIINVGATGSVSLPASTFDGQSSDICGIASYGSNKVFTCSDIALGVFDVTSTVTDTFGNQATCTTQVSVVDTSPPVVGCVSSPYTINVGSGSYNLSPFEISVDTTDACVAYDNLDFSLSKDHFVCSDIGSQNVTLTVTDPYGNSANCTVLLNIVDTTPPVADCEDNIINIGDYGGSFTLTSSDGYLINDGSSDICSSVSTSININSPETFGCSNLGTTTFALVVKDAYNNAATCFGTIDFEDTNLPTVECTNLNINIGNGQPYVVDASTIMTGTTAVCGPLSYSPNRTYQCPNLGVNTVTTSATDAADNTNSCSSTITLVDTVLPVANCVVSPQLNVGISGTVTVTTADINNNSYDACTSVSLSIVNTSITYGCSQLGTYPIELAVTDQSENTAHCFSLVQIVDISSPIAVCQDITVNVGNSNGVNGAVTLTNANASLFNGGSYDECTGPSGLSYTISGVPIVGSCSALNTDTVTLTVTDAARNTATCTATVTFDDTTAPVVQCIGEYTVNVGNGAVSPSLSTIAQGSHDTCGSLSYSTPNRTIFSCPGDLGIYDDYTVIVTDASGNSNSCSTVLDIVDTTPPVASCVPSFTLNVGSGSGSLTAQDINDNSYDYCDSEPGLDLSATYFTCADIGTKYVTLIVTDESNNVATCTTVVYVVDQTPPVANCQEYVANVGVTGSVTILPTNGSLINDGSYDICSNVTLSLDGTYFGDCTQLGTDTAVLSVTDQSGNVATCSAIIDFVDNTDPVITCQPSVTANVGNGFYEFDPSTGASATDICGINYFIANETEFGCGNIGVNPIQITVVDNNGNSASCDTDFIGVDTTLPIAICNSPINVQVGNNDGILTPGEVDGYSYSICSGFDVELAINQSFFNCSNLGKSYNVQLTVTDPYGNVATCISTVVPADDVPPVALCQPSYTASIGTNSLATVTTANINDGSYDSCLTPLSYSLSTTTYTCSQLTVLGADNTETLTVTDPYGNTATCTTPVTVIDNIKPTALCQNVILYAIEGLTVTADQVNDNSYDNCGVDGYSLSVTTFSASSLGGDTVLTVTDASGNSATCVAEVTIIIGQNLTVPDSITEYIPFTISWKSDITQSNTEIVTLAVLSAENSYVHVLSDNVVFGTLHYVVQGGVTEVAPDKNYLIVMILNSTGQIYGSGATFIKRYPTNHVPTK